MCVYSMIADYYQDKWKKLWENVPYVPPTTLPAPIIFPQPQITQEELKEFRELLERAKKYDKENNQKDCELDSKKETLRQLAKQLGVEIEFP